MLRIEVKSMAADRKAYGMPVAQYAYAAEFQLDGDADSACLAAFGMLDYLPRMHRGDMIVVKVALYGRPVARLVARAGPDDERFAALANFVAGGRVGQRGGFAFAMMGVG